RPKKKKRRRRRRRRRRRWRAPGRPGQGAGPAGRPGATPPAAGSGALPSSAGLYGLDCEPWIREKVLFLLHPERWLGTPGDSARAGEAGGEDLCPAAGAARDPDCERVPRGGGGAPRSGAPPRSVLVRIVDYQATEEVLWTAWTKGLAAARTQERSVTAITFRTGRE
uniref:Uncharacterized protein n=1 Tax=Canis lupus familiaris TaxID=9615 RepID=A0A8C0QI35_CANLF